MPPTSPTARRAAQRRWLLGLLGLLLLGLIGLLALFTERQTPNAPALARGVVPVRVQKTARGYQLLRGGKPYFLKGAGGLQYYDQLRVTGANTVRLWSTDYATPLLDEANHQGMSVMLGLWLEPEGKHFSYYDAQQVAAQRRRVRAQVLRFRHHPALLMWCLGNEVEQSAYGPRMFAAVNELAEMIHELDPYHPVTTALSNYFISRASQLQQVAPAVDIMSVNVYGELRDLPILIKRSQWQGPYIASEFGCTGYWQSVRTPWLAPLEPTSGQKADSVAAAYRRGVLADSAHCLGAYAFYWGSKFEYTPTWLSLFEPSGEKTELVDELRHLWRGDYPANRAPHLTALRLPGLADTLGARLRPGQQYPAVVRVRDPEGDSLTARWEMTVEMPAASFSEEAATPTEVVPGCVVRTQGLQATIRAPQQLGNYRLYVRVYDGHGSVATGNIPVQVAPADASAYSPPTTSD